MSKTLRQKTIDDIEAAAKNLAKEQAETKEKLKTLDEIINNPLSTATEVCAAKRANDFTNMACFH